MSRVTILCGSGCQGAHAELLALGERLKAPMVHALRGKEHVEWDNPYDVGMTGLIGFSSGYYAMLDCDVLLMLGTDFPYRQFYPEGKAASASRRSIIRPESRSGAARRSISASSATCARRSRRCCRCSKAEARRRASRAGPQALRQGAQGARRAGRRHAGQAAHPSAAGRQGDQRSWRREDAVFTCDVGLPTVWAARYLAMNGKRRLLGSFWHGSMANAMAQAIGAQARIPGRQVISLSGDGGFTMLMGDFLSLTQLGLPVKVVVFNNGALGFVELEQKSTGFLDFGTELQEPELRGDGRGGRHSRHPARGSGRGRRRDRRRARA